MKSESGFIYCDLRKLKVEIHKKNWQQLMIVFIIICSLVERILIGIGMPTFIIYIIDLLDCILLLELIRKRGWKKFSIFILLYTILIILGSLIALPNYLLWGGTPLFTIIELRNIIRFPVFFISCTFFLKESNIEYIYKILTYVFYINFFVILYQYFTFYPQGVWTRGDYLNGIFWTSIGGNTFVNVLNLSVVVYWLCKWNKKQCPLWKFLLPLCLSLTIAALIELKVFFVEVVILYAWYFLNGRKTVKTLIKNVFIILIITAVAILVMQVMFKEYPWFRKTMSLKGILKLVTDSSGYTGSNDLNRLTAVFTIAHDFFKRDLADILLGIGFGNGAAYSLGGNFTNFYMLYGQSHYSWFLSAYIFVQCGAIGLCLYVSSFIYLLIKNKNKRYALLSQIMLILSIILTLYNETLKTDAGYLIYFAIASGFVMCKGNGVKTSFS